eukprot:TRINITY_DN41330_c0_g1_i1.p1 TRINITY_DN41330_c0_g1~~TRINITY_DN41330_c0_g1_i1.p1  ORF type:complete len:804 (+),score=119.81 TRINITY_DN41330_c0_g1_i1:57-2468(+)
MLRSTSPPLPQSVRGYPMCGSSPTLVTVCAAGVTPLPMPAVQRAKSPATQRPGSPHMQARQLSAGAPQAPAAHRFHSGAGTPVSPGRADMARSPSPRIYKAAARASSPNALPLTARGGSSRATFGFGSGAHPFVAGVPAPAASLSAPSLFVPLPRRAATGHSAFASTSHQPPASLVSALARQNTLPPQLSACSPSASSCCRPVQFGSAPVISPLALGQKPSLADLAASSSSEHSPRDSVWKRYFCNAPDNARRGTALEGARSSRGSAQRGGEELANGQTDAGSGISGPGSPLSVTTLLPTAPTLQAAAGSQCVSSSNGAMPGYPATDSPSKPPSARGRHEDIQLRSPRLEQVDGSSKGLLQSASSLSSQHQLDATQQEFANGCGQQQALQVPALQEPQLEQPQESPALQSHRQLVPLGEMSDGHPAEAYPESPSSQKPLIAMPERNDSPRRRKQDSPTKRAQEGGSAGVTGGSQVASESPADSRSQAQERARPPGANAAALWAVAACAKAISVEDLLELGTLARPHAAVREVVESALMLLGYRDATWAGARARFERPEAFLDKLKAFDAARDVSRLQYHKLRRSLEAPRGAGSDGDVEGRCPAVGGLVRWCRAVGDMLAARYGDAPVTQQASPPGRKAALATGAPSNDAPSEEEAYGLPPPRPAMGDIVVMPDVYSLTPTELRRVKDLTIHKPKVGEVTFHGEIDLVRERRILEELPDVVRLEAGEVVLYPDSATKPKEGEGLNRPATITLFQCMPPNNAPFPDAESKARYRNRIAQMTESKGARFVDYDCDKGIWQFRVEHF